MVSLRKYYSLCLSLSRKDACACGFIQGRIELWTNMSVWLGGIEGACRRFPMLLLAYIWILLPRSFLDEHNQEGCEANDIISSCPFLKLVFKSPTRIYQNRL